jgi:hypothetical protein
MLQNKLSMQGFFSNISGSSARPQLVEGRPELVEGRISNLAQVTPL